MVSLYPSKDGLIRKMHTLKVRNVGYTEMPFDKYISLEKIFSDEEEYITDSSIKTDPLTILMMDNKEIEFIENVGMKEIEICKEIEKILLNQNSTIHKSNFKNK